MSGHNDLIDLLAQDLHPGPSLMPAGRRALAWWLGGTIYVVAVTLLLGPLRPGALEQLFAHPRFLVETLLGLVGIGAITMAVMSSVIPGRPVRPWLWIGFAALATWLLNIVSGLVVPTLEPGMLGKRPHCFSETLVYALPPMLLAIFMVRRAYPLRPVLSAMGAGLAAGLLPAWFMQMACMYETVHILTHHVVPGLLMVPIAVVLSLLLMRRSVAAKG